MQDTNEKSIEIQILKVSVVKIILKGMQRTKKAVTSTVTAKSSKG